MVKSDGCNKMTCSCGTKFCYLCRAVVEDYTHFCQTPHCEHKKGDKNCKGCPLWTKDLDAEHNREMREAALQEAKRVAEEIAGSIALHTKKAGLFGSKDEDTASAKVKPIDVESILQVPKRLHPRAPAAH
jgi:hypothetical protein